MKWEGNLTSGVIRTKGDTTTERIRSLLMKIPVPPCTPVQVVIEVPEFSFRQKKIPPKSMYILSRAIGAIQGYVGTWPDTEIIEATVKEWKGKMDKDTARMIAGSIMDRRITNHNEADAICLLDWFLRIGGQTKC